MSQSDSPTIAYYTVVDDERTGWTGGLLLLNSGGRPLEFQCTLPVRPSRAHEILFGSTLRSHLIREVIGPVLIRKCRTPISLLCCDQPEAFKIDAPISYPIALVDEAAEQEEGPITDDTMIGSVAVPLAGSTLRVMEEHVDQVRELTRLLIDLPDAVEPFERIREAIKERNLKLLAPKPRHRQLRQCASRGHALRRIRLRKRPSRKALHGKESSMWRRKPESTMNAEIDAANSWTSESLLPADTYPLPLQPLQPRCLPIRVSKLTTRSTGFLFPEANQWTPPASMAPAVRGDDASISANKKRPAKRYETIKRHRIKPPNEVVKLQDRLYYLLQPPLDLLVGSGQLNFPFEPFPYQLDGIAFLFPRYAGVLADEMGLGKTMQAISTIRLLLCSGEIRSVLLVCPKPLVTNWLREFRVWAPEIPIAAIEGNATKREFQWTSPEVPVKIANYELLMRDRETVLDGNLHFDLVVLDEAQRIKNRNSTTSEIVRAIPRTRSWALTGTPVENSPDDLVGIFDYLSAGYLKTGMPLAEMAKASRDYILRRTKEMVMDDMPPKLFREAQLDLTPEQWATYESAESEGVIQLEEMNQELTIQHVFELVLRLKQICNFDPASGSSIKLDRLVADMEEVAASGKKAIVFSQWVESIRKMRPALERFGPLEYHGRIPHKRREGVIDQFKNDPNASVILMSYGAGSVGLNLQFCEYVFLFDRWWNPAIEDQAINRAHRIGAKGAVTVTTMLAMNTIEQRIATVLDQKRQMFDALFANSDAPVSGGGLTRDEIFGLFDLRAPGGKKVA